MDEFICLISVSMLKRSFRITQLRDTFTHGHETLSENLLSPESPVFTGYSGTQRSAGVSELASGRESRLRVNLFKKKIGGSDVHRILR
jgi:hypothetical protein